MGLVVLVWGALAGCGGAVAWSDAAACDPRLLDAGEVRARRVPCTDELVGGGEGRVGDGLLENAVARFVVRGPYAALTELDEIGGTVVDAALADGGEDVLGEYRPDGDRSAMELVNGDGWAEIVLPGVTYHLDADTDALEVRADGGGRLIGVPGAERTGATLRDGDAFVGVDGAVLAGEGAVEVAGVTRLALSPAGLFPEGEEEAGGVDADTVRVERDGVALYRVPTTDGRFTAWVPSGAALVGEREGCTYAGLTVAACGGLHVRVEDDARNDLRAQLTDGVDAWTLPDGGGDAPVGAEAADLWVWAGPAFTAAPVHHAGGEGAVDVTLHRELSTDGWVLADFAEEVAPDADTTRTAADAAHLAAGEGVGFVVAVADDEVPWVWVDDHDDVLAVAASRAAGWIWSWAWSPSGKKPAHGAVPWPGLSALDQLTWSEGGASGARLLVVTPAWATAALAEAPAETWDPRPDALWLDSPEDVDALCALLDAWVDVAPVAERTWVAIEGASNVPAVEAGVVAGRTSAGTGPRVTLAAARGPRPRTVEVTATVEAARWSRMREVTLWTPAGPETRALEGGAARFAVPSDTAWAVAVATGDAARPWGGGPAWAVTAPLWIAGPP